MINPHWLDSAYIVENAAVGADLDDIAAMSTSEDTSIVTSPYRGFVGQHPDRVSHFQPVLDRLEVKPSLMDITKKSVLVEGKSDYVILGEMARAGKIKEVSFVPAHGATTMAPLIALLRGWGWPFVVLLDGDKAGKSAKDYYKSEYGIDTNVITLQDIEPSWKGVESIIHADDIALITAKAAKPTKKEIYQFFVKSAASGSDVSKLKTPKSAGFKKVTAYLSGKLQ